MLINIKTTCFTKIHRNFDVAKIKHFSENQNVAKLFFSADTRISMIVKALKMEYFFAKMAKNRRPKPWMHRFFGRKSEVKEQFQLYILASH